MLFQTNRLSVTNAFCSLTYSTIFIATSFGFPRFTPPLRSFHHRRSSIIRPIQRARLFPPPLTHSPTTLFPRHRTTFSIMNNSMRRDASSSSISSADFAKSSSAAKSIRGPTSPSPSEFHPPNATTATTTTTSTTDTSTTSSIKKLNPLSFLDGTIQTTNGTPFLTDITNQAWVTHHEGSLVFGLDNQDIPVHLTDIPFGKLTCRRWLCCARNKMWWMTPEWGTRAMHLPPETQFLLLELEDDSYAILLPLISDDTFRATLRPPRLNGTPSVTPDTLILRMESGDEAVLGKRWPHALLVASSSDPYVLIDTAVAQAAQLSGTAKPLRQKRLPPSINVFGWCSWDAFYSSVSAQGLTDAVISLTAGGVPPKLVIIDDGWQVTDLDSEFKGWQDPAAALLAQARGDGDATGSGSTVNALTRERYIEGESEMISAVLKDVPAGSATGVLLQEVKAANDESLESIDYLTLAQQHDATMDDIRSSIDDDVISGGVTVRQSRNSSSGGSTITRRTTTTSIDRPSSIPTPATTATQGTPRPLLSTISRRRRRHFVVEMTWAVIQYVSGLVVGAFQALIILFYQWVVDPAADGTWPVKFFTYMAQGPLRPHMLQFYADQTNFTRRLIDVRANSKFHSPESTPDAVHSGKEPNLKSVVEHLKSNHGVNYIYCWHGLNAYWSGINPDAPAMLRYNARMVYAKPPQSLREIEPSMQWNPSVLAGVGTIADPTPLYRDMHSYLAASGITGVKVDCQAGVGMVGSVAGGGPSVAARYHAALEDSVARHFPGNDVINCMCHSTENMYRWKDTAIARASDDYYPTDVASHTPHIAACAFNGIFLSAIALPDWDMFHSYAPASPSTPALHAAARAVSGGPVYVSDAPGCHGFDILKQLVLPDGSVLRALLPGRPTRDCLFTDVMRDNVSLLKVWNANALTGVVGVFNLQGASWDRSKRRFVMHSNSEMKLKSMVKVSDVEIYKRLLRSSVGDGDEEYSSSGHYHHHHEPVNVGSGDDGDTTTNGYITNDNNNTATTMTIEDEQKLFRRRHITPTKGCDFVAYVNKTNQLHRLQPCDDGDIGIEVSLDRSHAAIVTFAPVSHHKGIDFAPIGLINMLNSGGAITSIEAETQLDSGRSPSMATVLSDTGSMTDSYADLVSGELSASAYYQGDAAPQQPAPRFVVGVRGRGTLLILCSVKPVQCQVEGYDVSFSWKEGGRLEVEIPQVGEHSEQKLTIHF